MGVAGRQLLQEGRPPGARYGMKSVQYVVDEPIAAALLCRNTVDYCTELTPWRGDLFSC